jgi:hypothetical protein
MRMPRVRFTVRGLMVAVAVVGVVFVGEMRLYRYAAYEVGDGWDGGYIVQEAIMVWSILNAAIAFPPFLVYRALCRNPDLTEPEERTSEL